MRLVPTTLLQDGAQLARDVLIGRADGIPLLRAGVRITPDYRDRLLKVGIRAVYVEDQISVDIVPETLVTQETRKAATAAVAEAFQASSEAILSKQRLPAETVRALEETVRRILADVASSKGAALALADLA